MMSPLHGEEKVRMSLSSTYEFFNNHFKVNYLTYEDITPEWKPVEGELTVVWVMTGGVEGKFKRIYNWLPKPIVLLAEDINNSLAASLEIISFVNEAKKDKVYLLYGEKNSVLKKITILCKIVNLLNGLKESRIGSIGGPSEWLIASTIDYFEVKSFWGVDIVDIKLEELYDLLTNNKLEGYDGYFERAIKKIEPTEEDISKAHGIYAALKILVERYKLNALSLKCFDLLMKFNTTGCLALSRLTDEGIIAGCEGDLPSTFSMLLSYLLTGKIPFMANPSSINEEKNSIIFAHCTVPTKAVRNYILRSHFESGIGVGVQGEFEKGPITIIKVGGKNLSKIFFAAGEVIDNPRSEERCRTQIEVVLKDKIEYFTSNPLGNHQIIIPGDHTEILKELVSFKGLSKV